MSNVYITEPPTKGKVVFTTINGDIEVELWSKECPLACRNFVQLCMEKYYDNTIFHRLVKKFIIQGGDPTGTGDGGESIYNGKPFNIETHSRLRFNRRGLVAMHCVDNKVHGSQFFITLNKTPELQGNYTIFGSVVGNTVFNVVNLAEGEIDKDTYMPICPKTILKTEIIVNPFNDIVPRIKELTPELESRVLVTENNDETISKGPLSFMNMYDDEDDEEEPVNIINKSKSAHDHSEHANFSKETVKVDPTADLCVVNKQALISADYFNDTADKEIKEKIEKSRIERSSIMQELVKDIIKQQNINNESDETLAQTNSNKQFKKKKKSTLDVLENFNKSIKDGTLDKLFGTQLVSVGEDEDDENGFGTRVVDPGVYNPDKYELDDPRNAINQRKRGVESSDNVIKSKKTKN